MLPSPFSSNRLKRSSGTEKKEGERKRDRREVCNTIQTRGNLKKATKFTFISLPLSPFLSVCSTFTSPTFPPFPSHPSPSHHNHSHLNPLLPSTSSSGTGGHTSEVNNSRSNLGVVFRDQYFLSRSITSCTDTGNGNTHMSST